MGPALLEALMEHPQRFMDRHTVTATAWHRGDPNQARRTLLAVFEMGQLLNQATWHVEQDLMFVKKRHEKFVIGVLNEFVARALEAMPNAEAGMQVRDSVMKFHRVRQSIEGSESFA